MIQMLNNKLVKVNAWLPLCGWYKDSDESKLVQIHNWLKSLRLKIHLMASNCTILSILKRWKWLKNCALSYILES